MADLGTLQRFGTLFGEGYLPSVGSWVQVAPLQNLTTILNAFNTLGPQSLEIFLFDPGGNLVGSPVVTTLQPGRALRIDIEDLVPLADLPFEGSIWMWAKGATSEGSIGLQAVDLDFIDRSLPAGHVLGSVHLMYDFIDTLGIPPYLDLLSPRVLVAETPEGAPRYQNFLGLAHALVTSDLSGPEIELTLSNGVGETLTSDPAISIAHLGSWFGDLSSVFPTIQEFLMLDGEKRGYGVINVREKNAVQKGLCAMIKVVDLVNGSMLVDHLNDRSFARPAMKEF